MYDASLCVQIPKALPLSCLIGHRNMCYGHQKMICGTWSVKHALCTISRVHCMIKGVLCTNENNCASPNVRDVGCGISFLSLVSRRVLVYPYDRCLVVLWQTPLQPLAKCRCCYIRPQGASMFNCIDCGVQGWRAQFSTIVD